MDINHGAVGVVVGINIKKRLEELGYCQERLANLSSISRRTVSVIESGQSNVTINVIYNIANALKVSVGDLFVNCD